MNPAHRFGLLVLISFGSGAAVLGGHDLSAESVPAFAKLEPGMSPEQVRRFVGAPQRVARQILYQRYREQWIYVSPVPFRLTFDCPRGQPPLLLSPPRRSGEKNHRGLSEPPP